MNINTQSYWGLVFGFAYKNFQPKFENHKKSDESFVIFLPFISILFEWRRTYKTK